MKTTPRVPLHGVSDRARWEKKHSEASSNPSEPSPFLREHAALLRPGRTVDLACGRGRNARLLAELGHRVIAVDFSTHALDRARQTPDVAAVLMDLERPGLRPGSLDNVVVTDFLDRRLFPEVCRWLAPGGALLWDTFTIHQREVGHPRNPRYLLDPGELLQAFRERLNILVHREGLVATGGHRSYRAGIIATRDPGI